jgi:hypothetical protein
MVKLMLKKSKNVRGDFRAVFAAFVQEYGLTPKQQFYGLLEEYIRIALTGGVTEKETVSAVRRNAKFFFSK